MDKNSSKVEITEIKTEENQSIVEIKTETNDDIIQEWDRIAKQYRSKLKTEKRTVQEVVVYLKNNYPVKEDYSKKLKEVAWFNIMQELGSTNQEIPKEPQIIVLNVENQGLGEQLYQRQYEDFKEQSEFFQSIFGDEVEILPKDCFPIPIIVGAEVNSGCIYVDGSPSLSHELEIFQGHNEQELDNSYISARYIQLLKKCGRLEGKG